MRTAAALLLPAGALLLASCGRVTMPQSPLLKWLERPSGRIAYVGLDGNIHTVDKAGGHQKDVTTDAAVDPNGSNASFFYQFPAWSPDARSLAFVGIRRDSQGVSESGVWTRAGGTPAIRVYSSTDRLPRYLSWSPDSSRLVFTTGSSDDREQLETVPAGGGSVRVLDSGTGFSWRWENRGARLAVHSVNAQAESDASHVRILDTRGVTEDRELSKQPGDFQAPVWSADGQGIIMAVGDAGGSTLYWADSAGARRTALAHVDGTATLDLSPDGRRLAWAARPTGSDQGSRSLYILDLAGRPAPSAGTVPPSPRPSSGDDYVAAFSWSPDGSKIAYFVPSDTEMSVTLKVLTVKTRVARTVTSFTPSEYYLVLLTQFGQYGESERLWSPDGRFLLYCEAQGESSGVMVAYADQPIAPRKIADGFMATWSPR